jgi:hypothetical protein
MNEIIRIIEAVMVNLNVIDVRGKENLARLYNSIDALGNLKHTLENPVVTEEKIDVGAPAEENTAE